MLSDLCRDARHLLNKAPYHSVYHKANLNKVLLQLIPHSHLYDLLSFI